jgi:hypothetical protein
MFRTRCLAMADRRIRCPVTTANARAERRHRDDLGPQQPGRKIRPPQDGERYQAHGCQSL